MHIAEGVLAGPVLLTGAAGTAAGCVIGLKKIDYHNTPRVAVMSSTFFVASLIHIPLGPISIHLLLNGLIGIILGWASFPALLVALFLQALIFQFGGITTLGINTLNMALPAVLMYYLFAKPVRNPHKNIAVFAGFFAGFLAVLIASLLVALALVFTGKPFLSVAKFIVAAHIPVMIIEGIITAFVVGFLRRVKPEILGGFVR